MKSGTEVSYYDFGTQTTVSKQCSRYTGTLYIDGLLNRYGKYRFTFTAYDVNGTFLPVKNQKFVLEIFRVICDKRPKSRLILVGEGPQLENCKEYAKQLKVYDNVIFTGRRDDVQDIYSALDVLLFPSMYEGFPNVVLEAQTAGLPCCISDVITPEVVLTFHFIVINGSQRFSDKQSAGYQVIFFTVSISQTYYKSVYINTDIF